MWTLDGREVVQLAPSLDSDEPMSWIQELLKGQFARVVKGVDLRSTGFKSAWVRTPQLTLVFERCRFEAQRYRLECPR